MDLTGRQLIAGAESAEGSVRFAGVDPRDGRELRPAFAAATDAEIDGALRRADEAYDAFRTSAGDRRAAFLRAIADEIEALGATLVERASAETGLPVARLEGERGRTTGQLRMFADLVEEGSWVDARIDRGDPERSPVPKPDLRRVLVAIGPVVVFGASNFPLAFSVAGGDTASAFAAGCPVVVKAHPAHPGTSELVARAIIAAARREAIPAGVFSLLHGPGPETGAALVRHPLAKAVGFTGSLAGGRALFDLAASRPEPIPVHAEMGSTNPVFVLPEAARLDAPAVARALQASYTLGVGQFCTKPGLVVGVGDAGGPLADALSAGVADAAPAVMLHGGLAAAYRDGLAARVGLPGVRHHGPEAAEGDGAEVAPALLATDADTFLAHEALGRELFGPATVVITDASPERALRIARSLEGHLTATIHGTERDLDEHAELVRILERKVGRLLFGGVPTGVEVGPAMHHGGPYPASTDVRSTSVGTAAILRFARPICYQDAPHAILPPALRDGNPDGILRQLDGTWTRS